MSPTHAATRFTLRRLSAVVLTAVLGAAALPAVDAAAAGTAPPPSQHIAGLHWVKMPFVAIKRRDVPPGKHKSGASVNVTASDGTTASLIPAPPGGPARSTWVVNYDSGFTTAATGPQAQAAFQAAVDIWARIVYSPVPIVVNASYADLGGNVLGQAAAAGGAACPCIGDGVHVYPIALANALYGSDLAPNSPDINAQFNSNPVAPFYYGTDGAPTSGTVDFESVVLHELGHGLGFAGSMSMANGATTVTYNTNPAPMKWDTFLVDGSGTQMVSYPSGSTQLTTAMESPLYWSGANGTTANGGTHPTMYAPASWEQGSSGGAHLDETTYPRGDNNSLMSPAISAQEAVHSPGADAVAMFRDIGWNAALPTGSAPTAPTGVTASRGDGRATVSWNASTDYGNAVTQYVATASPGGATCTTTGALTCDVTGLTNGTSYTFTVTATNSIGASGASSASSAVVPAGKPATPSAPTATPKDSGAVVSWTAPSNNGAAITGYDVQSSSDNGTTWSSGLASALTSTTTQATFSGLTNGTPYVFRVAAINGVGEGTPSLQSSAVTPAPAPSAPDAPTGLQTSRGDTQSVVSWTAPASNGGSAVTGYRLEWSSDGGATWSQPLASALTSTATGATVTGLTNGTPYVFHVAAVNAIGTGAFSGTSTVTPAGKPAAPTNVTGTPGNGQVTVNWTAPASNGDPITGYDVESSTDGTNWSTALPSALASTATSAVVSSLTNGQPYRFRVAAVNGIGTGTPGLTAGTVTPAAVPGVPTNVSAVRGNTLATLSWTAPTDNGGASITSYTVRSSTDGGAHWTILGTTPGSPVNITGLTNGTPYVFAVAATNSAGTGSYSATSNSVTPATSPGAPTAVSGAAGDGQVCVTWTAPSSNGGDAISGYDVEWSSNNGSTWSAPLGSAQSSPTTAALVTGLTNGTPYLFKVAARNGVGAGTFSADSSAVTPAGAPSTPTSVNATAGDHQVTVSWQQGFDGGSAILSYDVRYSGNGGTSWTSAGVAYAGSPATVTGLTNGTSYLFEVAAINGVGTSGYSAASGAAIPSGVPGTPTGVSASPSDAQATVSWITPSTNGSTITGYFVRYSGDGGAHWSSPVPYSSSPALVTGLTNGTPYLFEVAAQNVNGIGSYSSASTTVTPSTTPGVPAFGTLTAGNASVALTWTAPADGGSALTGYSVEWSGDNGTNWSSPLGSALTSPATSATVTGLTNGVGYLFRIAALNVNGSGSFSDPSTAVSPVAVPDAPANINATRGTAGGSVDVSWDAPSGNGAPVTAYVVRYSSDGGTTWTAAGTDYASSPVTVAGLTAGTPYVFDVAATNSAGTGLFSAQSGAVTPATLPGVPTQVTGAAGDAQVSLSWNAPSSDGSSAVTGYDVVWSSNSGASWSEPLQSAQSSTTTSAVVTGLTNGTTYLFRVAAINAVGAGAFSTPSAGVTPATVPGVPTALTVTRGDGSGTVGWTAPSDGGSAITSYDVRYSDNGGTSWTSAGVAYPGTSAVVSGLANGTSYVFDVAAINGVGTSAYSSPSTAVTPATTPDAPTAVTASRDGDGAVAVTWTAPAGNGAPVTGYAVEWSSNGTTWSSPLGSALTNAATAAAVTGLTNGTSYTFRVAAINDVGTGSFSAPSAAVTPATVPGIPTGVSATAGDSLVQVSWQPPTNGGAAITSYDVRYSSDGGTTWTSYDTAFTASPGTVTGLTNGTSYLFEVAALNEVGASGYSTATAAVKPWRDASSLSQGASTTVNYGTSVAVGTVLRDATTGVTMAGYAVDLLSRTSTALPWSVVKTTATSSVGAVKLVVKPAVRTMYAWRFIGVPGHAAATSAVQTLSVAQTVSGAQTATSIVHGGVVKFYGTVAPNELNQYVYLQVLVGRTWQTTALKAKLVNQRLPNGHTAVGFVLALKTATKGTYSYRVYRPATAANSAGLSKVMTLRVT